MAPSLQQEQEEGVTSTQDSGELPQLRSLLWLCNTCVQNAPTAAESPLSLTPWDPSVSWSTSIRHMLYWYQIAQVFYSECHVVLSLASVYYIYTVTFTS